ncbi:pyridoxamine 5'-phosphate oxidase family protein [Rhizobium leguminosarum]|uniref:pyridoxamine 5'-phosphate oxidase family protein n=1 Tax=Rhizobium leguminosarum TaxID=384 RepID=UPI000483AD6D|nr:pyridoxamine 5'-phosphate oxidase family protein [Rhizobium leguminosarum]
MRASELKLSAAASGRRSQNEGRRAVEIEKHISSDVAFSPSVKEIQARKGSRRSYSRVEERGGWATEITPDLKDFIEKQISIFMATANKECQPYIQHRGGPPGFLRVIDETTLGFADYIGNRQYITQGNLVDNDKAQLFLIDYGSRSRVKIWGTARVVEDDPALLEQLMPKGYQARPEQVILFHVEAWDANCPQHIPLRFEADEVLEAIESRDARIKELEAEIATLKSAKSSGK